MSRIVIGGASEVNRTRLEGLLQASGYKIFRVCATGGALRRALCECEDGLVIFSGGMPDASPDDIVADFGDTFQLLLIDRPEALTACEAWSVFRLAYPCTGNAVLGAVEMLTQLHAMRLPKRSGDERALVDQAKQQLMRDFGIDEPEAHRRMQQYAMRHGIKMTAYAAALLQGRNDDAR